MPPRSRHARGHIETLPSGSFRAVVYSGADPLTNKPRYIRETHKTHAAAQVALTRLQGQVDEERHPRTDITVRQAVAQWLEVVDLADTTREGSVAFSVTCPASGLEEELVTWPGRAR